MATYKVTGTAEVKCGDILECIRGENPTFSQAICIKKGHTTIVVTVDDPPDPALSIYLKALDGVEEVQINPPRPEA